jgi:hypothetical protein
MKRLILAILIFSSLNLFSQETSENYQSIDHVKALNFDLFEEIGFDKNKIKSVCRVIYSMQKKTQHMASNGASPVGATEALNEEAKYLLQKVLSETEYKKFKSIQHKIK